MIPETGGREFPLPPPLGCLLSNWPLLRCGKDNHFHWVGGGFEKAIRPLWHFIIIVDPGA